MSKSALERLQAELGHVRIVFALRRFDELRPHEAPEIDRVCHCCMILVCWSCRTTRPATFHPAPNARWLRTGVRAPTARRHAPRNVGATRESPLHHPYPILAITSSIAPPRAAPALRSGYSPA